MDFISRQAAIDEFEKELSAKYNKRELAIGFVGVKSILQKLPSAQPEIVRCKDCKYASPNEVYGCKLSRFSVHDRDVRMDSEDYCSMAERRTDDES